MDDKNLMENLLLLEKGVCDLYLHGTIEASTLERCKLLMEEVGALLSSRPEYNKQNQELFWNTPSKALLNHVGRLGNDWYYKYNTNEGFQTYKKDMKNPDMANLLTGFESLATKMNVSEVKEFLLSINENWKKISYLYSREDVRSLSIRPVGYYIGLRHLCRQTGEDIQFSVFYPDYK